MWVTYIQGLRHAVVGHLTLRLWCWQEEEAAMQSTKVFVSPFLVV
jgi:hypothetical protein